MKMDTVIESGISEIDEISTCYRHDIGIQLRYE